MSTQTLVNSGAKPVAYDFNGLPVHVVGFTNYEEKTFQCTPPTLNLSQGSTTQIALTWSSDDVYVIEDFVLEWIASNASATEAPRFLNTFQTLSSLKVLINGNQEAFYMDQQQIQAGISLYLSKFEKPYNEINKARQETGVTLVGDQVAVSSTQAFSLPLGWLVPELRKMVVNLDNIYKVEFQITFQQNTQAPSTNSYFVKSNTTSNAYSTNLTYSNILIRQIITRHSDRRMYAKPQPQALICSSFDTVFRNVAWNTINTDRILLNLANDFTKRDRILGLYVWGFDVAGATAYNNANSGVMFSGPAHFGYQVKSRSNINVDHLDAVGDLQKRRRYMDEYFMKRFGHNVDMEVTTLSTNLGKHHIFGTYIDLSNVYNDEDAVSFSGRNNNQNDIEIILSCASAVSANCNIYIMPEYQNLWYVDAKTKSLKYI